MWHLAGTLMRPFGAQALLCRRKCELECGANTPRPTRHARPAWLRQSVPSKAIALRPARVYMHGYFKPTPINSLVCFNFISLTRQFLDRLVEGHHQLVLLLLPNAQPELYNSALLSTSLFHRSFNLDPDKVMASAQTPRALPVHILQRAYALALAQQHSLNRSQADAL